MALQMTVVSTTGLEVENAYIKIDDYSCDENNLIRARIRGYVGRELEKEGKAAIEGSERIITVEGDYSDRALNMKIQIYDYMKTLPDYKNAIDVFE
ncbi:hypothetical protein ACY2DD_05440 [Enterococcus faecium]